MGVGVQTTANDVNNTLGGLTRELTVSLEQLHLLHVWYVALGAGGLTNAPYSFTAGDDATVGSALSDAEQLYQLFHNNGTLGTAKDFTTFMGKAWGFGF